MDSLCRSPSGLFRASRLLHARCPLLPTQTRSRARYLQLPTPTHGPLRPFPNQSPAAPCPCRRNPVVRHLCVGVRQHGHLIYYLFLPNHPRPRHSARDRPDVHASFSCRPLQWGHVLCSSSLWPPCRCSSSRPPRAPPTKAGAGRRRGGVRQPHADQGALDHGVLLHHGVRWRILKGWPDLRLWGDEMDIKVKRLL